VVIGLRKRQPAGGRIATQLKRYANIPLQQPYRTVMKIIFIFASLLMLAPVLRADDVVVRHDNRPVVVHEHYRHHRHHEVVVVQHN
jgi:hypothetical protein